MMVDVKFVVVNGGILTPLEAVEFVREHISRLNTGEKLQIKFVNCIWERQITNMTIRDDPGHLDGIEMAEGEVFSFPQLSLTIFGEIPREVVEALGDFTFA